MLVPTGRVGRAEGTDRRGRSQCRATARRRRDRGHGQRRRTRRRHRLRRARRRRPEDEDPQGLHREAVRAQRPGARRRDDRRGGEGTERDRNQIEGAMPTRPRHRPRHHLARHLRARRRARLSRSVDSDRGGAWRSAGHRPSARIGRAARSRGGSFGIWPASRRRSEPDRRRCAAGVPVGRRGTGRHWRARGRDARARANHHPHRLHARCHPPAVRARSPQDQSHRRGDRRQGVRGGAGHSRRGGAARLRARGRLADPPRTRRRVQCGPGRRSRPHRRRHGRIVWTDRHAGRRCARRRGGVPRGTRLEGDAVSRRRR